MNVMRAVCHFSLLLFLCTQTPTHCTYVVDALYTFYGPRALLCAEQSISAD